MNEIEKQIEEMARKISYAINNECKLNNGKRCEDCSYNNSGDWECQNRMIASYLYGEGYRNCKDKVVRRDKDIVKNLKREIEFWKCRSDQKNQILERFVKRESDRLRISRKETARDIFAKLKGYYHPPSNTIIIDINDFYEMVKEYGMEVQE